MKIGLISDTHNYLDPAVTRLFEGVEYILHAGDVGAPAILSGLVQIAPVTAVRGNTDDPALGYDLTREVELAGFKFLLHHIVNPSCLTDTLLGVIKRRRPDFVVFGHTHKFFNREIDGVHFVNPGYAGKLRFNMPRSVAVMELNEKGFHLVQCAL